MNNEQWNSLLDVVDGRKTDVLPTGFIIDSPWLPGWYGVSTMDYYSNDQLWFEANKKAIETFKDVMFLPGFWAEYGMCTEPSAFGAKCRWETANLPHAEKISSDIDVLCALPKPHAEKDGLLPFIINRLKIAEPQIEAMGHGIKFAVARGPLNIASFLFGTTELMLAMMEEPGKCHRFIGMITDFTVDWIGYQMEKFPSIEGILLLDDIVGFLGDDLCREYVVPCFKKIYGSFGAKINFLHNDAAGLVSAPYLQEMGVNLFNYSFEHTIAEMQKLTGNRVALLGNIPPRDILKAGSPQDVREAVRRSLDGVEDFSRIIMSCGGGMPQEVSSENIFAFCDEVSGLAATNN
ncbi:MAG: uroporphyrinogen decarboxylase [Verrucomicrobia bacterium]|nr:MAG: uroporphyrinogen decarboxylase [Verrucomicrobiota bacterium]